MPLLPCPLMPPQGGCHRRSATALFCNPAQLQPTCPVPHPPQALEAAPPPKGSRKQASLEERSWLAFLQHVKGSSGEGLW